MLALENPTKTWIGYSVPAEFPANVFCDAFAL